ncbi:MAG: PaaI family thioesterase [Bacteriovoracaceae bacterium]
MKLKETLQLFAFSLFKVPLLAFIRPRVISYDDQGCCLRIPFRKRNLNHLNSMYFGVLCSGADLAAGWVGMTEIRKVKEAKISFVFQKMEGEFLRRPLKDTDFICREGENMRAAIARAIATKERVTLPMLIEVKAAQGENNAEELVARFTLLMSMKVKA